MKLKLHLIIESDSGETEVVREVTKLERHSLRPENLGLLLLLARLGLRASEVAQLKLADIDWHNGSILVCGKARRQESLPLPQEVGNAILLYLKKGRPWLRAPEGTSVLE